MLETPDVTGATPVQLAYEKSHHFLAHHLEDRLHKYKRRRRPGWGTLPGPAE